MASSRPLIGLTLPPAPAPHRVHGKRHKYSVWSGDPYHPDSTCCDKPRMHPIHTGRFTK